MIRPFTLICMASAFGAGLYLYQSKHAAQVLDREITRTLKQTETTRERTGMLKAEWALLNEPDRLAELARAHLPLQTLKPTQFAAMGDLGARLPAPVAARREPLPAEAEPDAAPVAQAAPPAPTPAPAAPIVAAAAPKPRDVASAVPEPKAKPEPKPEPKQVAEAKPAPRPVEKPAAVVARAEPVRPAEPPPMGAVPVHARAFAPPPVESAEATAPGTVGAAVLRAMRARANDEAAVAPAPVRAYAPPPYQPPAYQPPAYAQPAYAQPAYAQPAGSVLGGRSALPPPVPFAAR